MNIKLEEFEIKVEEEDEIDPFHPEQETFEQDSPVCSNIQEISIKEELKQEFYLNQNPLVSKSVNSEFVKVEKETESEEEKLFIKISASKFPKVLVKRLSTEDLKSHFKGLKDYDFKKYLLQIKYQEGETSRIPFKARKACCKNADANLGSKGKVITKHSTSSSSFKPEHKCVFCKSVFKRQIYLERHMHIHSNAKLFKCLECSFETNYKRNLKRHILTHGPKQDEKGVLNQNEIFKCCKCSYKGKSRESLKYHLLSHNDEKQFKCSQCSYGSNCRKHFKRHVLQHNDMKLLKCAECGYSCNEKYKLRRHMLTHSQIKLFRCSDCGYGCNFKDSFYLHMFKHHQLEAPADEYVCSEKYKFQIQEVHKKYSITHRCSECGFESAYQGNLKQHMLRHLKKKRFKCSECNYESNQKSLLKVHLLNNHSEIKLFRCSECNYGTNAKKHLKGHIAIHSKEKLFKCSECDYGSNYKRCLKIHVLKHSNEKLFKCSECDYECNVKGKLKVHMVKHRPNIVVEDKTNFI